MGVNKHIRNITSTESAAWIIDHYDAEIRQVEKLRLDLLRTITNELGRVFSPSVLAVFKVILVKDPSLVELLAVDLSRNVERSMVTQATFHKYLAADQPGVAQTARDVVRELIKLPSLRDTTLYVDTTGPFVRVAEILAQLERERVAHASSSAPRMHAGPDAMGYGQAQYMQPAPVTQPQYYGQAPPPQMPSPGYGMAMYGMDPMGYGAVPTAPPPGYSPYGTMPPPPAPAAPQYVGPYATPMPPPPNPAIQPPRDTIDPSDPHSVPNFASSGFTPRILIWCDASPANNDKLIRRLQTQVTPAIRIILLSNTQEIITFFTRNLTALRTYPDDGTYVRIMADRRHGTDIRQVAGPDGSSGAKGATTILDYVRSELRMETPILVYCWRVELAQALNKPRRKCWVSNKGPAAFSFGSFQTRGWE